MAKILVVDDSSSIRQMLVFILEKSGHQVIASQCAEEALQQLDGTPFELVLTDLNMPGISGMQLAEQLRTRPLYQTIPILVMSTETSPQVKQQCKAVGVTGWVAKPFDPAQLVDIVERVVQR